MLVSPEFIPPYLHLHLQHMRMAAHLPDEIFYFMPPRGFIGAPYFFLALKTRQI